MRVTTLTLTDFKRFAALTIDLSNRTTKIVAVVGPNGSGKSSVLDAFEEIAAHQFKGRNTKATDYFKKSMFDASPASAEYDYNKHIALKTDQSTLTATSFYIRSAYRFTPRLGMESIRRLPDVERDESRPQQMMDQDGRLRENYERLLGRFFGEVYDKDLSGKEWAEENIEGLNNVLAKVLDIRVSFLGNPVTGEGRLYFEKGTSKRFPYENLSAGEKEVVDLVLDLYVKKDIYSNSVICIDEPELHLNTAIQRKLLIELEQLVPENAQLWIATHSIGFLRALQEDLWEKTAVIDFTSNDFDQAVVLEPIAGTRADWSRIFATALEDLTGLLAPKKIVYCEGRADPSPSGAEQGLDAEIYNSIFGEAAPDTLFVSSGGGGDMKKNAMVALSVLRKALTEVDFFYLKDRDELTDVEREAFLAAAPSNRMLQRREIENYILDKEVLTAYCASRGITFNHARYDAAVTDIVGQDLKLVQEKIKRACSFHGKRDVLMREAAEIIVESMSVYKELQSAIF